jgi:type I restriction enzyme, S subunit
MWDEAELPEGWKLRKIGDVANVVGGGTPKTNVSGNFSDTEGHPWITPADLTDYSKKYISYGRRYLTDQGLASSSAKYMPANTVLFSTRAPIGYVAIAQNPVTTNQGFRSFVPTGEVDAEYLYYALKFLRPLAEQMASGTTFPELSGSKAAHLPIAYPLLMEQQRIVKILDIATEKTRSAGIHLHAAYHAIECFRQAILAAATTGRLTADWREEHGVISQKLPIYDAGQPRQLRNIESYDLDELPEGWVWLQVENLLPPGGIFDGPFGSNLKTSDYTALGARVIRLENIGHLKFIADKQTFVSTDKYRALAKHAVYPGDIVFSSFVEEQVRVCVLPENLDTKALAKADCFTIRPSQIIDRHYLALQLASQRTYRYLAGDVHGATRPRVNTTQVRSLPVPLCTLEEQREIVRRYEQLVSLADSLEQRLDKASRQIERSSQAVLAKAFRGELTTMASEEQNTVLAM